MTAEQTVLLQLARDNIRAAQLLTEHGLYSIAVSRTYYAMFYVAEAFLLGKHLAYSKHAAVIAAFGQQFIATGLLPPEFHRNLIDAERKRHLSD